MIKRITWRAATVTAVRWETKTARTLVLDVPGWSGHLPGQHVDIRLTADDGYVAQRSYSIASAWSPSSPSVELTIQRLDDGEVSPYLTDVVEVGDKIEVRGAIGNWFVWRDTQTAPVLLIAGGSGVVPLMAMIRARGRQPFRLIYSVRTPEDAAYAEELRHRVRENPGLDVHFVYTRKAPEGAGAPKRIDVATINSHGWPPDFEPDCYVCGPTGFVETAADILVALGHAPTRVRTERFGGA
ncbi:ferredoxin-NADP reductase [Actinoplanes lutulentus]|uniref:Ferredoxin-NADP reductase n=1 Tax=Actinoplanes lutulentus TaxID=1287878 RepID=A0A327ZD37_9ACTN|nr:ferredoxin reductase [Actinoplanes lutulentus]MBB2942725.1 ferredoxin-NADP reductase [Actinoplanes lutulentus]RAK38306.1 ferredoxin-NADP reductase [Actinoplanes lutulentus]